jgi:hypothetical protein
MSGEHVDVGEAAPSRVDCARAITVTIFSTCTIAMGIRAGRSLPLSSRGRRTFFGAEPDRVAHVRVDMKVRASCRKLRSHRHSNAAVDRLVSICSTVAVSISKGTPSASVIAAISHVAAYAYL